MPYHTISILFRESDTILQFAVNSFVLNNEFVQVTCMKFNNSDIDSEKRLIHISESQGME